MYRLHPGHPRRSASDARARTGSLGLLGRRVALAGLAALLLLPAFAGLTLAQEAAPEPIRYGEPPEPIRYGDAAAPDEPRAVPDPGSFVRIRNDEAGEPAALETATVRYVSADGSNDIVVDLIGVVHFGDSFYYQRLNGRMAGYDALLYELVAPESRAVPGERADIFNTILQKLVVVLTDLDSQLASIDYTRPNFVHADLSPRGIAMAMRERGESRLTLALGVLTDILREYNKAKWAAEDAARRARFGGEATPRPDREPRRIPAAEADPTMVTRLDPDAAEEPLCCGESENDVCRTTGLPLTDAAAEAMAKAEAAAAAATETKVEAPKPATKTHEPTVALGGRPMGYKANSFRGKVFGKIESLRPSPFDATAAEAKTERDESLCCGESENDVCCTTGLPLTDAAAETMAEAEAATEAATGAEACECDECAGEAEAEVGTETSVTVTVRPDSVMVTGKRSPLDGIKRAFRHYVIDPLGAARIKRIVAHQMASDEAGIPPTLERILIDDRNAAVMQILEREIAKGHRRIGIFYGAAHMPDLESRLMTAHGMRRESVEWMSAWDLSMHPRNFSETVFKLMR